MADYVLRLLDPFGDYVATLDTVATLDYALPANDVGALTLSLPPVLDPARYTRDSRLLLDRTVRGLTQTLVWLVRRVENTLDENGARAHLLTAFDPRDILRRRVVAVASQSHKTGAADDVMKAIVRENYVTTIDPARAQGGLMGVAADVGAAPVITMDVANRNVLDVLRDIAAASAAAGTYLAFDVVPVGSRFEFRTYAGVWGVDRREQLVLSAERGTLSSVAVVSDWTEEYTAVYASGRGTEAISAVVVDSARILLSPFGRIETYLNASGATTDAAVTAAAAAELQSGRAREQFSARFVEQPGTRYGVDLALGDLVRAEHDGTFYDCRVEPVRLTLDERGAETIDVQLRSVA